MVHLKTVSALLALSLIAVTISNVDARALKQSAPPPITADQLTQALSRINAWAKVPDIAPAVAATPNYALNVAQIQGPAAAIVQASYDLTSWDQNAPLESTALYSYGYQLGTDALSPIGKALYNAYDALTKITGFSQTS